MLSVRYPIRARYSFEMHEILCDNSRRVPSMHLGDGTHSKDSLTYADKWLLKEHNAINIQFVRAHSDELLEPLALSVVKRNQVRCTVNDTNGDSIVGHVTD